MKPATRLPGVPVPQPESAGCHTVITATAPGLDGRLRVFMIQTEPNGRITQHELILHRSTLLRQAGPALRFIVQHEHAPLATCTLADSTWQNDEGEDEKKNDDDAAADAWKDTDAAALTSQDSAAAADNPKCHDAAADTSKDSAPAADITKNKDGHAAWQSSDAHGTRWPADSSWSSSALDSCSKSTSTI